MATDFPAIDHRSGVTVPALLFWDAALSTLPVFWVTVGPSLGGGAKSEHADHWLIVFLHGLFGALTLVSGFTALYMGWRRGSQRQWASHQRWMIRSMVLTWSFVFCRLAQRVDDFEGVFPALGVWLYWVGPMLIAEVGLWWWGRSRAVRRGIA